MIQDSIKKILGDLTNSQDVPDVRDDIAVPYAIPTAATKGAFRQLPPLNSRSPQAEWNDAFKLDFGSGGARVHRGLLEWFVTTLTFEKKSIYDANGLLLTDVNHLVEQAAIEGVQTMGIDTGGVVLTPLNPWLQLNWFGRVYAVVELNEATGKPVRLTIEGPSPPIVRPIPRLDESLSRGSSAGGRCGFSVYLGNVTNGSPVNQVHTGPLQWYLAFVPESEGSVASSGSSSASGDSASSGSSSASSSGSSSASSSASSSGSGSGSSGASSGGSSKDTAIVPHPDGGYCKWYAMEAAEVLFFDFQEFELPRGRHSIEVDPVVSFGCEPNSLRAWTSPDVGTCHATVTSDRIRLAVRTPRKKQRVQVMLKGVRRGFANVRNAHATFEDFVDNECRLNPRLSREQVIAELAKVGVTK